MIDWQKLLATPYGARLDTLCAPAALEPHQFRSRWYRTAPNQYLQVFEDPVGQLKYCGFAWVASEGAARIICMREGWAEVGPAELPPAVLLPRPGMLSAEEIAAYGMRTEPESFSRHVDLTHQVHFGDFRYHYRLVTPRPTDAPIAVQVDRCSGDPALRQRLGPIEEPLRGALTMSRTDRREPWLAALANFGGSGIGSIYSGQALTGVLLLGGAIVTMLLVGAVVVWLPPSPVAAGLVWFLPLAYTCVAAALGWRAARAAPRPFVPRWYNRWYWYLAYASVVYVGLIVGAVPWIRNHVMEAFRVPSGSMEPTVLAGEFLMVPREGSARSDPHRGAIVVYTLVEEPGLKTIKRIAGIAGDTLAMRGGQLLLNGQVVDEPYVRHDVSPAHADPPDRAKMRAWQVEHFAGAVPADYSPDVSDWGPVVVSDDMIFVLGDNRDHSYDSRHYGFIPTANVLGRPRLVYWSLEPPLAPGHIRWSRLGHPIK